MLECNRERQVCWALVDGEADGAVFFLPDEAARQIAEVTAAALNQASGSCARDHRGRTETTRSRRGSGPGIAGLDLLGR